MRWELNSSVPGVGLLLSRYAPHDTYTIWKRVRLGAQQVQQGCAAGLPGMPALSFRRAVATFSLFLLLIACVRPSPAQGSQIRVDGSLMGVREAGQSLLPEWKRGHFSLLYNGAGGGEDGRPLAVFVNRAKNKFVDLQGACGLP